MRILCDQHVPPKYLNALESAGGVTVTSVRERLRHDAPDTDIAAYAEANDWVVLTNDDDFFSPNISHGLLVYSQVENPLPRDIVDAVQTIDYAYEANDEILEKVPNGWI